jgi:hypothetical protein
MRRASSDASRSREKKHLHLRKQKALANADADADDDDAGVFDRPPSTRPHDLRASPDDEAKHAFRGTCRGTCDDRSESERRGRVSSSRDRKPRRLGGRLVVAGTYTSRSRRSDDERVVARVRSRALDFAGIDVPAPATGSADRERLDSVTLSIWPCVFVVRERASATGATRVSNAREKTNAGNGARSFFEKPLAKFGTRARAFGATCATAYLRARAEHRSARLEAFLFEAGCDRDQSTGSRVGWSGRGDPRR